ncbi:MAG: S8 family serine peptidase, partial [Aggregatilineales bacterium]
MMKSSTRILALLLFTLLLVSSVATQSTSAQTRIPEPTLDPADYADLLQVAREQGRVRVIVSLAVEYEASNNIQRQSATQQTARIRSAQETVFSRLQSLNAQQLVNYDILPYTVLVVDEAGLLALIAMPEVNGIFEDVAYPQQLASAGAVIGATVAHSNNYTGAGQAIAILDSGAQSDHPFFGERIVQEACFSVDDPNGGFTGVCPNGQYSQVGAGSAQPCVGGSCDHGTHVTGIAAGANGNFGGQTFDGIAPDAQIISVQVNSLYNSPSACGFSSPCAVPTLSTIISGLQYVYQIRNEYNIAVVNMSLGSTAEIDTVCTGVIPPQEVAINLLVSVDIAVVAGSGNAGNPNGLSAPACQPGAISVGATADNDSIASFSNSASFLDLLAPGVSIVSSVPGSTYGSKNGTSMATPVVSGAIAILRQAAPNATVSEIMSALQSTGVLITDARNGVTTPRIQIDAAIAALLNDTVPTHYDLVINEVRPSGTHAIELFNADSVMANIANWKLQLYGSSGSLEAEYTFPSGFTLPAGEYVTLYRGTGSNTSSTLYIGNYSSTWSGSSSGAVRLTNGVVGIDFMRWNNSTVVSGVGTGWTNENPSAPGDGKTLGRDSQSFDMDSGFDFATQNASLNAVNIEIKPANDNLVNATNVTALPFTQTMNNRPATEQNGDPVPSCATLTDSVWYRYQPTEVTTVQVDTVGSGIDTALAVFQGTNTLAEVGCNDDIVLGYNPSSRVVFSAQPGVTYTIMVGTFSGFGGKLQINIDTAPANDSILGAEVIDSLPYTHVLDNSQMTSEGSDPAPSCNASTNFSLWYRFTASQNTIMRFDTAGTDYDTILSIFTGSPGNLTEVACHDDVYFSFLDILNADLTSSIDINVTAGVTYYLMISSGTLTDFFAETGTLYLNATDLTPTSAITQTAPNGAISTGYGNPLYQWSDTTVDNYELYVARVDGTQIINPMVSRANICNGATCSIDLTTLAEANRLTNGAYQWYVREAGGTWTTAMNFTLDATAPALVTLNTTTGTDSIKPTFHWGLSGTATNATYFNVYIAPSANVGTPVLQQWYTRTESCGGINGTTCSLLSPIELTNGVEYQLYIQSYGPGGYSTGGTGGYAGPDTFTINIPTPQPISPNGTVNLPLGNPLYTWTDIAGAEYYYLYVANSSGSQIINEVVSDAGYCNGTQCQLDATTLRESYRLPNGAYTFYVRGWKDGQATPWSGGMSFTVNSTLPGAVTKVFPLEGESTAYNTTFQWNEVANVSGYNLYLVNPNGVASGVLRGEVGDEVVCSTGTCGWNTTLASVPGTWTWYVQAFNSAGAGAWSAPTTFTAPTAIPDVIAKVAPTANQALTDGTATFSWTPDGDANQYQLYMTGPNGWVSDVTYEVGVDVTCATNCSVEVVLPYVGDYLWYLRGYSAAGWGKWSAGEAADGYGAQAFSVTDTLPSVVAKIAPTNAQNLDDLTVTFSWTPDAEATYYQSYVLGPNGFVSDRVLMVGTDLTCASTCDSTLTLPVNGAYSWYLRGYSAAGWGAWSAGEAADNYGVVN